MRVGRVMKGRWCKVCGIGRGGVKRCGEVPSGRRRWRVAGDGEAEVYAEVQSVYEAFA